MLGSKGKWRPKVSLPVCSVAMTVEKWYNKYIIDLDSNRTFSETTLRSHSDKWRKPVFIKPITVLVCNGFWTRLQIRFANYLRAKEKWAEALGEKFLGLSCGLVPAKEDTETKFRRKECSCRQTDVRMNKAIRAKLVYKDRKLEQNRTIRKIHLNALDVFLHHLQCIKSFSAHLPQEHSSLYRPTIHFTHI